MFSVLVIRLSSLRLFFFFQAEDGIRDPLVTGVQTCALPISPPRGRHAGEPRVSGGLGRGPREEHVAPDLLVEQRASLRRPRLGAGDDGQRLPDRKSVV